MNTYSNNVRLSIISIAITLAFACAHLHFSAKAEESQRILNIKERVVVDSEDIMLKDFVVNQGLLSEKELEYVLTTVTKKKSKTISMVDLAYMMQRYQSLMDVSLRGASYIVIRKKESSVYLDKARKEIINFIKNTSPWKTWTVDVLLNSSDETIISRVGKFDKINIKSFDNKAMLGTISLRVVFIDDAGSQIDSVSLNPVILRKVEALVVYDSCKKGHIIKKSDIKRAPMWVGSGKKDYLLEEDECIGKELARNLTSGDFIKSSDILMPVCAKKGDIIWVECTRGQIMVKVAAIVMENGREGDFVKVRNKSSNNVFEVKLVGEKKAVRNI